MLYTGLCSVTYFAVGTRTRDNGIHNPWTAENIPNDTIVFRLQLHPSGSVNLCAIIISSKRYNRSNTLSIFFSFILFKLRGFIERKAAILNREKGKNAW